MEDQGCENTDREIWRGPSEDGRGSFYADSIFVTKDGGIGINCGGSVYVKPVREWWMLAGGPLHKRPSENAWDAASNRSYEPVEKRAAEIYASFGYDGPGEKPAWVPCGNSLKQDLARYDARQELRQAGHVPTAPNGTRGGAT